MGNTEDFSDIFEGLDDETGTSPPDSTGQSGLHRLTWDEMVEKARLNQNINDLGKSLVEEIQNLIMDLKNAASVKEIGILVNSFNKGIVALLVKNEISKDSNFVKVLEGIRNEFETIVLSGDRFDKSVVDKKVTSLIELLRKLADHIKESVQMQGNWEMFDQFVPGIMNISPVSLSESTELEMSMHETRKLLSDALYELRLKSCEEGQKKLELFASGDLSLDLINVEWERYIQLEKSAEDQNVVKKKLLNDQYEDLPQCRSVAE
jgi:hypothetical protein